MHEENFWAHFFGRPYRLNGTKARLDAALIGLGYISQ